MGICGMHPNSSPREKGETWLTGEMGSLDFLEFPADAYPLITRPPPSSQGLHQPAVYGGSTGQAPSRVRLAGVFGHTEHAGNSEAKHEKSRAVPRKPGAGVCQR